MRNTMRFSRLIAPSALALLLLLIWSHTIAGQESSPPAISSWPADRVPAELSLPPTQTRPLPDNPIEPELLRLLQTSETGDPVRVIVYLREQIDLDTALGGAPGTPQTRSRAIAALQAAATASQASLQVHLELDGAVEEYAPFWIVNAIAIRASPSAIESIAARPDVAAVHLDHYRQWLTEEGQDLAGEPQHLSVEWGVARIRADAVWNSLHVSGTGAVVAGMDTGVDWLHPVLQTSYRGYNPHGPASHIGNWYDATGGALYPVDGHGHGSHTMGTMVGQDGVGVAPGARWIAVKVLNNQGYGYDSWIHAGFQWLLAPGGNPAMAPDVVNCSWGNDLGSLTTFQADILALRAAGILAVFSNGNNGPNPHTVGSPASLPGAFAVGATDADDRVASFSSRGPSLWGEIRPHVAAPGVAVRSSLPGDTYGSWNGTSMAAPHVSGIVALLRSVSPTLSITRTTFIITSTAVPLGSPLPNNNTGWGRADAFAAVAALAHPGFISGTVTRAGNGIPIAAALVYAVPREGGGGGTAISDATGHYWLALAPTTYDLTASAFGYGSANQPGIVVLTDTVEEAHFSLTPLPAGSLQGCVTDADTGAPLTATITALGTPVQTTASHYTITLPAGTYTVDVRRLGYRVATATVQIDTGQVATANFALRAAPTILLVDSGSWYYESQASYFRQALDDLATAYDEWPIKALPDDVPTAEDLSPYDIVLWSAPHDAPAYIGAEDAITGYLSAGGRLLLSGQDIGFLDGGGAGLLYASYYGDYLKVYLARDNAGHWILEGAPTDLFAGMVITITGSGGADNQDFPDEIGITDPDAAAPVLAYQGGGCGGARIGTCLDYRVIYLSFGFEAIDDRAARREVMERALDWLATDPPVSGLDLTPARQTRIALPGSPITHTLQLRHLGQAGSTETFSLTLAGASWPTQLSAPSLTLAPCTSTTLVVTVTVPATATWNMHDTLTVEARSTLSTTLFQTTILTTKAPAPILLVDDDRWYEQRDKYRAAMEAAGFPYDEWQTHAAIGSGQGMRLSVETLQGYPIVIWWTGYDWYRPVTTDEEAMLAAYLAGGGRLFLSSQDFLYYHHGSLFSREYLGILDASEDVTPTLAAGVPQDAIGDRLGPYALSFPFRNWSDAVIPTPGTAVVFRDQARRGIALARDEGYKTLFLSFPFEALPADARPGGMERAVGWLSWLGRSSLTASRGAGSGGETLTYTIVLRHDGPTTTTASLSNTLPLSLTLDPATMTGPAAYDPGARLVWWNGMLGPGALVTITYRVTMATGIPPGALLTNTAQLGLEDQGIYFRRSSAVRVGTADLAPTTFACAPSAPRPGRAVTCTLALVNSGPADALAASAAISLPTGALFEPASLAWQGGGTAEALTATVRWAGPLSSSQRITVTFCLTSPAYPAHPPLYSVAFLDDGAGGAWERAAWISPAPWRAYLPLIHKNTQ